MSAQPTAGAMRAARYLRSDSTRSVMRLAEIIDREAGVAELVSALNQATFVLAMVPAREINGYLAAFNSLHVAPAVKRARSILAKHAPEKE